MAVSPNASLHPQKCPPWDREITGEGDHGMVTRGHGLTGALSLEMERDGEREGEGGEREVPSSQVLGSAFDPGLEKTTLSQSRSLGILRNVLDTVPRFSFSRPSEYQFLSRVRHKKKKKLSTRRLACSPAHKFILNEESRSPRIPGDVQASLSRLLLCCTSISPTFPPFESDT